MDNCDKLSGMKVVKDFEKCALDEKMTDSAKQYFSAEACSLSPIKYNEQAFNRYRIRPRVLRDVSKTNMHCQLLGTELCCPLGISPTGLHGMAHPDGELATVRGCCKEDCVYIMSSAASTKIEAVSEAVEGLNPVLWMQVYIHKDRNITLEHIRRAESAGFSAIVVTVDSPNCGLWRKVMPQHFFRECSPLLTNLPCLLRFLEDPSLTFKDLNWLKDHTKLPVIVKGILSGDDAREAIRCGASAVFVSNHGSRLVERVVSPIDVLEEIVEAVKDTGAEVYLDGGVRSGSDVFVSLALGAKAVFIGRPAVWGLAVDGENGVRKILQILKEELFITMQLAGVSQIEEIKKCMIVKV